VLLFYHQNNLYLSKLSVLKYHPFYIWHYNVIWIISVFKIIILGKKIRELLWIQSYRYRRSKMLCELNIHMWVITSKIVLNCSLFCKSNLHFSSMNQLHKKLTVTTQVSVTISQSVRNKGFEKLLMGSVTTQLLSNKNKNKFSYKWKDILTIQD